MSFLAPWYLLLAGAAVVPLLIHLLRRRIGLHVEFPAARYLARAEREHSRTMRMRNLLLMLLRMLLVLLVALAAARPTARSAGAGHAPTALAILIDNSMSAGVIEGGAPLLDHFKRTARDALRRASPDDRVWLVTADGLVRGGTPSTVGEEIDRVRALAGAGMLPDALARAIGVVEGSGIEARQVAILTDGQRSAWTRPIDVRGNAQVLVWAPSRAAPPNRAVTLAEARPARWTPRGAIAVRTLSADSTTYRMILGQRTLARGTVAPGEESTVRAAPAERGWIDGTIEIEPDELAADNVRHFALWIGPAPAVQVAAGAGQFVKSAVDVLRSTERVAQGEGGEGAPGQRISIASADEAGNLPALLLAPTDPVRIGAANRTLERLGVPWRFGAPRRENAVPRGPQLGGVTVALRYQLVRQGIADADTLAVVGREAWVVGGRRYVLIGSPLTPDASTLPINATFLPWLGDILSSRLHGEPGAVRFASPNERVAKPVGIDAMEGPDGRRTPIAGNAFDAPAAAGTYFLIEGTRRAGALVVNPEVDESRLDRFTPTELRQRIASPPARRADSPNEWANLAFTGASRRSLAVPFLILALIVLVAETLLAGGLGTSRAPRAAPAGAHT